MHTTLAIEIQGLRKQYKNGTLANDGISFEVEQGSILAVLGPNGAGKTTMIRQLTGELSSDAGSIRILGIDVMQEPLAAKRLIGVVPQEAQVFPDISPRQHLQVFGRLHGLNEQEIARRSQELLQSLALAPHADKIAKHLSGGLKRKVLLGIALMPRPQILILDEPTTGLDPHARREVWQLIKALQHEGSTVLITTHYMDEAEALSERVLVIGAGRILASGTIEELRAQCRNRYKATYIEFGEPLTIFGQAQTDIVQALADKGIEEFSLTRTSLEDLYLELTGTELEAAHVA